MEYRFYITFFIESKRHEYQQRLIANQRTLQESEKCLREAHDELERRVKARTADLSAVNEKYRLLVENANDAIFIAQDEVVKFPNPKTIEMVGYSKDELARTPFLQLIHFLNHRQAQRFPHHIFLMQILHFLKM